MATKQKFEEVWERNKEAIENAGWTRNVGREIYSFSNNEYRLELRALFHKGGQGTITYSYIEKDTNELCLKVEQYTNEALFKK